MGHVDGGELLVRALRAEGVDVIVSISDIASSPIVRSADAAGIRHVGPRHESAAVHMVDAFARTSGRMAVAIGAAGPGVANMVPGVMCAWVEGIRASAELAATCEADLEFERYRFPGFEADIHGLRFDVDRKGHKSWLVDCVKE